MNKIRTARLKHRRKIFKIVAAIAGCLLLAGIIGSCVTGQSIQWL